MYSTITGLIKNPSGTPMNNVLIRFSLIESGYSEDTIYSKDKTVESYTDNTGSFSINVWANSESVNASRYKVEIIENGTKLDEFLAYVPTQATIDIEELIRFSGLTTETMAVRYASIDSVLNQATDKINQLEEIREALLEDNSNFKTSSDNRFSLVISELDSFKATLEANNEAFKTNSEADITTALTNLEQFKAALTSENSDFRLATSNSLASAVQQIEDFKSAITSLNIQFQSSVQSEAANTKSNLIASIDSLKNDLLEKFNRGLQKNIIRDITDVPLYSQSTLDTTGGIWYQVGSGNGISTVYNDNVPSNMSVSALKAVVEVDKRINYMSRPFKITPSVVAKLGSKYSYGIKVRCDDWNNSLMLVSLYDRSVYSGINSIVNFIDLGDNYRFYYSEGLTINSGNVCIYLNITNVGGTSTRTYYLTEPTLVAGSVVTPAMGLNSTVYSSDYSAQISDYSLTTEKYVKDGLTKSTKDALRASPMANLHSIYDLGSWTFAAQGLYSNILTVGTVGTLGLAYTSVKDVKVNAFSVKGIGTDSRAVSSFKVVPVDYTISPTISVGIWVKKPATSYGENIGVGYVLGNSIVNYMPEIATTSDGWTFYGSTGIGISAALNTCKPIVSIDGRTASAATGEYLSTLPVVLYGNNLSPLVYLNPADLSIPNVYIPVTSNSSAVILEKDYNQNVIDNPIFKNVNSATGKPLGYNFSTGGAKGIIPNFSVSDFPNPIGGKVVQATHYYNGTNNTDLQLISSKYILPANLESSARKISIGFYAYALSTNVGFECYVRSYNSSNVMTIYYPAKEAISLQANTWQFHKWNLNLPPDCVAFEVGARQRAQSTSNFTDEYAYMTGITAVINRSISGYVRNSVYESTDLIKEVASSIVPNVGNTSNSVSSDTKGNRIRRVLEKLMTQTVSTDPSPQNKIDNDIRIVHIGDSIVAQGWSSTYLVDGVSGTSDGRDFVGLKLKYPKSNFHIVNAGVGGHRMDNFKKLMFHSVIPYDPDLVILSSWGNDGGLINTTNPEEFYSSMDELLSNLRRHTVADIMVCNWSLHDQATYEQVRNNPMSKIIRILSDKYNCEFVDIARHMYEFGRRQTVPFNSDSTDKGQWTTRGYFNSNDVHPNTSGQIILAQALSLHFPDIDNLDDSFEWNGANSDWYKRVKTIQAESALEYDDSRVKVNDIAAWNMEANTNASSYYSLNTVNSSSTGDYVEFKATGTQFDLWFTANADGGTATITVDGVPASSLSKNSVWYPDADDSNYYKAVGGGHAERDAKIKYVTSRWKTSEVVTLTMTGANGQVSTSYDAVGSVSGVLGTNLSVNSNVRLVSGQEFISIRSEDWNGKNNIYAGDKFYIYIYNNQAINLHNMGDWYRSNIPLIQVDDSIQDTYYLRFAVTGVADGSNNYPFRLDAVKMVDRLGEAMADNVIKPLGTGNTSTAFNSNGLSISLAELQRVKAYLNSSSKSYFYVNRKHTDTLSFNSPTSVSRKVTLASGLENKEHTIRITRNSAGKIYLDALVVKTPNLS